MSDGATYAISDVSFCYCALSLPSAVFLRLFRFFVFVPDPVLRPVAVVGVPGPAALPVPRPSGSGFNRIALLRAANWTRVDATTFAVRMR